MAYSIAGNSKMAAGWGSISTVAEKLVLNTRQQAVTVRAFLTYSFPAAKVAGAGNSLDAWCAIGIEI